MVDRGSESIDMDGDRMVTVSNIVGAIAHDFNNLLTPFLVYPQLIKGDLPEGANARALLDVMEKTAKDMLHVTRQLLEFSAKDGAERQPIDVNGMVSSVLSELEGNALLLPGVVVKTTLAPDIKPVAGVMDLLMRVLYNICSNALDAIGEKGQLGLQTGNTHVNNGTSVAGMPHVSGEYVRITVTDSGPGVAENIRSQIFNPFFTTKKSGSRRGAGLGLSIAYKIVKEHGGFIDFASNPGQGSDFSVYFPAETGRPLNKSNKTDDMTADPPKELLKCNNDRIMIVDDEKTILRLFQMILSAAMKGYTIDVASNGEEAVSAFSEKHHAVIIMDLHMPVMDGQAAFFKIESLCKENNWEIPAVVFCTGFAPPDSIRGVVESGSKHCLLQKPVRGDTIVEAVKSRFAK
ncbi:MAG: ATP-binding protein [Kiritimatiellae bacterium]|nr:ATP-binding protein [Kiritimatiellia bacterium]MDD5522873.1 ATP-binding protein [Kiritimatiellia bacterium]